MDVQRELVIVLNDVDQFLVSLTDVLLPRKLEEMRQHLAKRVFDALSKASKVPPSPEPYIDMTCGKSRTNTNSVASSIASTASSPNNNGGSLSDEYIEAVKSPSFLHGKHIKEHHEMSFQDPPAVLPKTQSPPVKFDLSQLRREKHETNATIEDDENLSAREAKDKAFICGVLHRKEKKCLMDKFSNIWAALIGSRLLIYEGHDSTRPKEVMSIKKCMAIRQLASYRNSKRADSTFEILFPDKKVYQFSTATPDLMLEWVEAIRHYSKFSTPLKKKRPTVGASPELYEDVGNKLLNFDEMARLVCQNDGSVTAGSPQDAKTQCTQKMQLYQDAGTLVQSSDDSIEEYNDAGDFRAPNESMKSNAKVNIAPIRQVPMDMYQDLDEVRLISEESSNRTATSAKQLFRDEVTRDTPKNLENHKRSLLTTSASIRQLPLPPLPVEDEVEGIYNHIETEICDETYDDIGMPSIAELRPIESTTESRNEQEIKKCPEVPKKPVKAIVMKFLAERRKNGMEFQQKENKKNKLEAFIQRRISTGAVGKSLAHAENRTDSESSLIQAEYINPPPPRPVHGRISFAVANEGVDMIYDDVGTLGTTPPDSTIGENYVIGLETAKTGCVALPKIHEPLEIGKTLPKCKVKPMTPCLDAEFYQNLVANSNEENQSQHYQIPKSNTKIRSTICSLESTEETYDEVGNSITNEFPDELIRKRNILCSNETIDLSVSSPDKTTPEKKSWNIFGIKSRSPRK